MSFDNQAPGDNWINNPAANPDNGSHLDKIRQEVTNAPPPPAFYGINLGIVKLGFTSDGAFNPGVDLGIVHAEAKVGLVNGADAGVNLGPIVRADAGAYGGVDQNGFKVNAAGDAQALGFAGAGGSVNARLGNATGIEADGGVSAAGMGTRGGFGAGIGGDGLDAAAGGGAHIGRIAGVHGGAHLGLNSDSQVGAGVGGNLGDLSTNATAGVWSDGNNYARPDIDVRGRAGYSHGDVDINPPGYYGAPPAQPYYGQGQPYYGGRGHSGYAAAQPAEQYPTGNQGIGRTAPIEVQQLPPVHEAATPENKARFEQQTYTELANKYSYTVHKGDTYEKIASKLMPGADSEQLAQEAAKLKEMHESNGYTHLHAGQKLATLDPYALDRMMRAAEAKHFGTQS